ncbi:MAG: YcaO-like family protein [Bacilli bacterium]
MINDIAKDDTPSSTINKIKKILLKNRIKIKRYSFRKVTNKFYSTRIELRSFYNLGVNGKGISKKAALASAYAEFMERFQSFNLIRETFLLESLGVKYKKINLQHDYLKLFFEKGIPIKEIEKIFKNNNFNKTASFYNAIQDTEEVLPIGLINCVTHTNGLCSGNNKYEALVQGICEVFERHCYKQILCNNSKIKNINLTIDLKKILNYDFFKKEGYEVYLKDCSLNIYPVVGLLIKKNNKYLFVLGSHLDINIAAQRCITESLQGINSLKELYRKMKKYDDDIICSEELQKINWIRSYSSNNGTIYKRIDDYTDNIDYKEIKIFENYKSNLEYYNNLKKIIEEANLNLYIKDYSVLGFPTYKVYIPTLSEIDKINLYEIDFIANFNLLKNIYFNIEGDYSECDISKCINSLKQIINCGKYSIMNCGKLFSSANYISTPYNNISIEFFYYLLKFKNSDDKILIEDIMDSNIKKYFKKIEINNKCGKFDFLLKNIKIDITHCPNCKKCNLKKKCSYKKYYKLFLKLSGGGEKNV